MIFLTKNSPDCILYFKDYVWPIAVPLLILYLTNLTASKKEKNKHKEKITNVTNAFKKTLEHLLENLDVELKNLENFITSKENTSILEPTLGINLEVLKSFNPDDLNEIILKNKEINYLKYIKIPMLCEFINQNSAEKLFNKYNEQIIYWNNTGRFSQVKHSELKEFYFNKQPMLTKAEIENLKNDLLQIIKNL